MPHPNEETLRKAYDRFAKGDIPGFLSLCTPDFRLKVPGKNRLSGDHDAGRFLAMLGPMMEETGNTFRETVLHLAANDADGFVLVAQQIERGGELLRWNAVHHYDIVGGKLSRFWEFIDDQTTFDRAWR